MTERLKRERARRAAREYMTGVKLRRDSRQLANKSLGSKFDCSERTINRVKQGLPTSVLSEEDQALVRLLTAEKVQIDKKLPALTKEYLGYKHQVSRDAIDLQLELLGFAVREIKDNSKGAVA